jgi:Common central domain of tyrosinase
MSDMEWAAYHDAVQKLHGKRTSSVLSLYEDFIVSHAAEEPQGHRGAYFLVWHRQFLWEFESALRRISPQVTVCFPAICHLAIAASSFDCSTD